MEIEEDTDVDILGDFDLVNNLAQLSKFKDEQKLKKEKRIGFKRNRCYSVFKPNEEIVKISKFDSDLNEDIEVNVEEDEANNDESMQTVYSEESTEMNKKRGEKRKTRNSCSESENNSNDQNNLPISELHYLILCATGLGDGAITLTYNDNGRISKVNINKTYKTYKETFRYTTKTNSKRFKLDKANEKRIYCKYFDSPTSAPFLIKFRLEALIVAECHAHGADTFANAGLFRGYYAKDERTLYITGTIPIGMEGVFKYDKFNEETIVGWYFAFPLATTDSYVINVPFHNDLRKLFTNSIADPFIMMAFSPFNRIKTRCVVTFDDSPYVIDYDVYFYEEMTFDDAIIGLWDALYCSTSYPGFHIRSTSNFNDKTYGQLCYESIRRLLDSTSNRVSNDIKNKLMIKLHEIVVNACRAESSRSDYSSEDSDSSPNWHNTIRNRNRNRNRNIFS